MKKWLLALGLTGALVLAGCGSDSSSNGDDSATSDKSEEQTEKQDENNVKKEILNAQMNVKDTFKQYQAKIVAYQEAVSAEEPDAEAIKAAGEEAKTAANEAAEEAANYTVEVDLPEEVNAQYTEAVASLQAYYEEVANALDANLQEADFTKAEEQFTQFSDQLATMYEEVGLLAPDMMKELS